MIQAGNNYVEKKTFISSITFLPEDVRQEKINHAMDRFLQVLDRYIDS